MPARKVAGLDLALCAADACRAQLHACGSAAAPLIVRWGFHIHKPACTPLSCSPDELVSTWNPNDWVTGEPEAAGHSALSLQGFEDRRPYACTRTVSMIAVPLLSPRMQPPTRRAMCQLAALSQRCARVAQPPTALQPPAAGGAPSLALSRRASPPTTPLATAPTSPPRRSRECWGGWRGCRSCCRCRCRRRRCRRGRRPLPLPHACDSSGTNSPD